MKSSLTLVMMKMKKLGEILSNFFVLGINRYKAGYFFIQSPSELEVEELRGLKLKIKCLAQTRVILRL